VRGSHGQEAGRRKETTKGDGAKRKKEEDDWVRSWFPETTIKQSEGRALT
jgi:hypothetical protein